jgi:hypothetical protein
MRFCSHRYDVPYGEGFFLTVAGAKIHLAKDRDSGVRPEQL